MVVVLVDVLGEDDEPHHLRGDHPGRRQARGPVRCADGDLLGVGVEADPHDRAKVQARLCGGLRVHDRLVRIVRVGQPPRQDVDAVPCRVLASQGALDHHWFLAGREMAVHAVDEGEVAVDTDDGLLGPYEGKVPDGGVCLRVVADGGPERGVRETREGLEVGRVDRAEVRHIRRLGPPRAGDRSQGHAAEQSDEDDQRDVLPPPSTEGGAEPVCPHAQGGGRHGTPSAGPYWLKNSTFTAISPRFSTAVSRVVPSRPRWLPPGPVVVLPPSAGRTSSEPGASPLARTVASPLVTATL